MKKISLVMLLVLAVAFVSRATEATEEAQGMTAELEDYENMDEPFADEPEDEAEQEFDNPPPSTEA